MQELDWLAIVLRWMHILAAMTAVGGTIFMRMALVPSVSVLPDDQRKALHEQVRSRWVKFVMGAILFLLVSGLINFFRRINAGIPADVKGLYHGLFGVKFLLALVIFFLASALTGRAAALARFRQNAKLWLSVNLTLAVIVVCISGVLRFIPEGKSPPASTQTSQEAQPRDSDHG
ncbi:MAG TPA: hypothetical protein VG125_13570 [Pirellulales bacterium]|jgi:uncharacterized membrane protein|nr:hypothetical protein [Pirellulales bacterium]